LVFLSLDYWWTLCFSLFFVYGFGSTPLAGKLFSYCVFILLIAIYGKLLYDSNQIRIDTEAKTITFVNLFTRHRSSYHFSDFDGKLVWLEPMRGFSPKNYYLIQNRKAVKKISSFIYSNQKELEHALTDIHDFGLTNYSYLKSWKVFFGFPIID
jgi:hypothetical protein